MNTENVARNDIMPIIRLQGVSIKVSTNCHIIANEYTVHECTKPGGILPHKDCLLILSFLLFCS